MMVYTRQRDATPFAIENPSSNALSKFKLFDCAENQVGVQGTCIGKCSCSYGIICSDSRFVMTYTCVLCGLTICLLKTRGHFVFFFTAFF